MSGVPDYPLEETLDFKFTTRAFSTGVPTTLAGTPVVQVYEDNSLTQITAGITLTVDFDSVTGLNNLRIVATAANGYESGKSYSAVITTGTVGGTSVVGEVVQQFTIERSPALRPTVAGRTLDVATTGEAGVDFSNINGTLDAAEIGTDAITADKIAADAIGSSELATSAVNEIRDAILADSTPFNGADIAAILTDTNQLQLLLAEGLAGETRDGNLIDQFKVTRALIEHQRGAHTHQPIGNIFFVDPVNGDTHANGNRGGIKDPYLGVQDCHDNAVTDSNHDVIILLSGAAGVTTLTEDVSLTKRYLFIRGPGRDFIWTRSGAGDTITITADGIELAGFQLNTAGVGSGHGIAATSADFFRAFRLWINDTRGDGINLVDCDNFVIKETNLQNSGQSGAGDGISVSAGTGESADYGLIERCRINDVQGDAIRLDPTGTGTVNGVTIANNSIQAATGDGVDITGTGAVGTQVVYNVFGNNSGQDINDNGTNTISENNEQWCIEANALLVGDIADAVWDEARSGHTTAGTYGEFTGDAAMRGTDGANTTVPLAAATDQAEHDATQVAIAALNDLSAAEVNAEMVDVLSVDTQALPGQAAPPLTPTIVEAITWLYKVMRNRKDQSSSLWQLYADNESTVDAKATITDAAGTTTKQEIVSGP